MKTELRQGALLKLRELLRSPEWQEIREYMNDEQLGGMKFHAGDGGNDINAAAISGARIDGYRQYPKRLEKIAAITEKKQNQ